jgi:hypothetical protein
MEKKKKERKLGPYIIPRTYLPVQLWEKTNFLSWLSHQYLAHLKIAESINQSIYLYDSLPFIIYIILKYA